MSDHPRRARVSRLDPADWPSWMGIVLLVAWLGYAVACTVWVQPLLWTVLPSGLALFLFAGRYPWRVVLTIVMPLTLLTVSAQIAGLWFDAPTWVSFAIYLVACVSFSFVLLDPSRDRWIASLPAWLLGEPFAARLAWTRFEESLVAANASVRQFDARDDAGRRRRGIERLAAEARRESDRGGPWAEAWAAHASWLDGLGQLVETEPTADGLRRVNALLAESDDAQMRAIERTELLDGPSSLSD